MAENNPSKKGQLITLRKIINIFLETPNEGKITVFYTFLNRGESKVDIIKMPRPYDPQKKKYVYLANLEIKDTEGKLLEVLPQKDPQCGQDLLCIKYTVEPNEQKTLILSYTFRTNVKYGGKLIKYVEFPFYVTVRSGSSCYLHLTPPHRLSLKCREVRVLKEPIPSTSTGKSTSINSYEIIAEPPESRGTSIRFSQGIFEVRIVVKYPESVRTWLYSVLIFPFISILIKLQNLLVYLGVLNMPSIELSTSVILSCIGTLIATRVWLFDETLTNRLNILYIILIIILTAALLFP